MLVKGSDFRIDPLGVETRGAELLKTRKSPRPACCTPNGKPLTAGDYFKRIASDLARSTDGAGQSGGLGQLDAPAGDLDPALGDPVDKEATFLPEPHHSISKTATGRQRQPNA